MTQKIGYYVELLQRPAFELQNAFIHKFNQNWGLRESVCELVIQIGHLVHAVNSENSNTFDFLQQPQRKKIENVGDELSDCLLSLLSIGVYADISQTDIDKVRLSQQNNILTQMEITSALSILSAQLLDSYEIYCGLKPSFKRDEKEVFISLWYKIFEFVIMLAEQKGIVLEEHFNLMLKDAWNFLNNTKD